MRAPCPRSSGLALLFLLAGFTLLPGSPALATMRTILSANFDNLPIDEPVPTGGPTQGEPVSVTSTITAFIHDYPFSTPSLKINDDDLLDAGFVRFQFLEPDTSVTSGVLTISADLWFVNYEEYGIKVRERRARSQKFCDLEFGSKGNIRYMDQNSPSLSAVPLGNYVVGTPQHLVMQFNLDDGIYSVSMDGVPLLTNETNGVPYGIGAVLFGMEADDDVSGEFSLDNLTVTLETPTATTPVTWAKTKEPYR